MFLTKYSLRGASSRCRTFQYLPHFKECGFQCEISPLFNDDYLIRLYQYGHVGLLTVCKAFLKRFRTLFRARNYDLIVIEYELLPYFPILFERVLAWLKIPYFVDYDDALYHQYDLHRNGLVRTLLGNKIAQVMRHAEMVTVGNDYLADYALRAGAKRVEVIPTVVNLEHYPLTVKRPPEKDLFTIGWIGSPSTAKYLEDVVPSLADFCAKNDAQLRLIGSGKVELPGVPFDILEWSEETEAEILKDCYVGIMPLPDEPWARGKCGFKLIQYMACGLPVVASPVGANKDIVEHGVNGFLANTKEEWAQALETLRKDHELIKRMGMAGRRKVEEKYCLQVTAPRYVELLKSILERR